MEGYVGVDPVRSEIVLAFRGTNSLRNVLADLDFSTDSCAEDSTLPVSADADCQIHSGFLRAWSQVQDTAYAAIASVQATYPNYTLVVTGHSLGAAVGTIAAAHLREDGFPCDLYTYGSPRVGNQGFVDFVAAQEGNEFRVTHFDDPVPQVPPSLDLLGGYRHLSPEYWLEIEGGGNFSAEAVTLADFKVCVGSDNEDCNASTGTSAFDVAAHRWYFRNISACGSGFGLKL